MNHRSEVGVVADKFGLWFGRVVAILGLTFIVVALMIGIAALWMAVFG